MQFEYQTNIIRVAGHSTIALSSLENYLNAQGSKGWKVCAITYLHEIASYEIIFEREKAVNQNG
jgi:hypothetical protein